jgi:uncharacterized membrane protein
MPPAAVLESGPIQMGRTFYFFFIVVVPHFFNASTTIKDALSRTDLTSSLVGILCSSTLFLSFLASFFRSLLDVSVWPLKRGKEKKMKLEWCRIPHS